MDKKRRNLASYRISRYLLVLGLVLTFASPSLSSASHIFPEFIKWHVYIVNGLSKDQILFTHCKSADDDIGIHNLSPGSNITWSFRTDFTHSTLFWCYVSKDNAYLSFEVFWYDERLFNICDWKNCIWVARDEGIYLTHLNEQVDELHHVWNVGM
ncbi:hypothetical protein VNO77_16313 [Canavalia gladiata]|uniref:S-protein homolog n=1 Tax=Canavalia gladiata TaxID=3824 RepID=A0AAN9M5A7_CANGL